MKTAHAGEHQGGRSEWAYQACALTT